MNCRFAVAIPVYNNPTTIVSVIEACLHHTEFPILVVDDGSDESVEALFQAALPQGNARVSFIRHSENRGKGIALQTAFKEALRLGHTHLVTIDGDGQHDAAEIPKLVHAARENSWALIIGDRDMNTDNVPGSSSFGKKLSNFWVRYQTEVGVADSQSGYRIYPLFFLQNMSFFCKKYDFEIEVLTRLIWKGVAVKNVRVSVRYFPKEIRVSHFHKWKDNFRISIANTFLTIGAMLREKTSPVKSSLAFALGVFIGTTPLYGLHAGLAAAVSFIFGLNFIYMWMGTHISLPPFLPFLVIASKEIGELILGKESHSVKSFGSAWVVGSVALGLILGLIAFAIMYFFKHRRKKTSPIQPWGVRKSNNLGIWFLRLILKNIGLGFTYSFLYFVVLYYFLFSWRTRRSFTEYWKIIRPEMGWLRRQVKLYQQIMVFAQTLVDRGLQREQESLFFKYDLDDSVKDFVDHLEKGSAGVVTVASHVGGWELAMTLFSQVDTEKKILAVMHGMRGEYSHHSSVNGKKSEVIFFNLGENTILRVKDYLNAGQVVGMMGDRPVSRSHEVVPFFGRLAAFDTTPLRAALACHSELYFVFAFKTEKTKYKVFTFKAMKPAMEDKEHQLQDLLHQYVHHLEKMVNVYPEQWFNFFPFWSEAPAQAEVL
jgi:predicted LPLAT superfamily acyltransferase/uncharacterized protein (DUF2062 family)